MRIILVDDHSLFREAVGSLFVARDPSLTIVGEAATARDGIKVVLDKDPDVIVMDILLRGASGIGAIQELRRLQVHGRILVLTGVVAPSFALDALAAGADGYALKEQTIDELLIAISRITHGHSYVAPRIKDALKDADQRPASPGSNGVVSSLSTREHEVFRLIVAGLTNQRISTELFISVKTVETHRTRINKKLCVHSSVELLRFAALHGLVSA